MTDRFEIKAIAHPADLTMLSKWRLSSRCGFKRTYQNRIINNIYFDTPEFGMVKDNLLGASLRHKVRFRWYELDNQLSPLTVEYKIKNARLGTKESYDIGLVPDATTTIEEAVQKARTIVPPDRSMLAYDFRFPVIRNQYEREYYESMDGHIRLTIDSKNRHGRVIDSGEPLIKHLETKNPYSIIELKFDPEYADTASDILQNLPFRVSRHSKYLLGISQAYRVPYF